MTGKFSQNRRAESDQKEGGEYSGDLKYRTFFSAKENNIAVLVVEAAVPEGAVTEKMSFKQSKLGSFKVHYFIFK